jgi:hypothetical protein
MDAGSIAHGILLEGSADGVCVIDPADHPAEKTGNIPDGWTNKSIRAARDEARAVGKIPVLLADMATIRSMVNAAQEYIKSLQSSEPAVYRAFLPDGGSSEVTMIWQDGATLCRMRPDRISANRDIIINYKTTAGSVEPDRWSRTQLLDYYVGGAFYVRGTSALCDTEPTYLYLCQETAPPYLCSLVGLDAHFLDLGARKVVAGLSAWERCVKSGQWPGYPPRVCYPEVPAWEESRWLEREVLTLNQRLELGSQA